MTMNQDGNTIGRLGAAAIIAGALWGVHEIQCSTGYCPTMQKPSASCCPTEAPAAAAAPAASPSAPLAGR